MPITQDRMTALLTVAQDLEQALGHATRQIAEAEARAREEPITAMHELQNLAIMCTTDLLLAQPFVTKMTLDREARHWTESRVKANGVKRERLQAKRHYGTDTTGE